MQCVPFVVGARGPPSKSGHNGIYRGDERVVILEVDRHVVLRTVVNPIYRGDEKGENTWRTIVMYYGGGQPSSGMMPFGHTEASRSMTPFPRVNAAAYMHFVEALATSLHLL